MAGRALVATDRVVLIGPEGGWSDSERSAGLERVRIGSFVLRAETAAVVAGGLLVALRDGVTGSGDPG